MMRVPAGTRRSCLAGGVRGVVNVGRNPYPIADLGPFDGVVATDPEEYA